MDAGKNQQTSAVLGNRRVSVQGCLTLLLFSLPTLQTTFHSLMYIFVKIFFRGESMLGET